MTLAERLTAARRQLEAAGFDAAAASADVDVLARALLRWDRAALLARLREPAPPDIDPALSTWIARRAAHEPVAYITGQREFWGLSFEVTPDVLIPRPETELVLEEALRLLPCGSAARAADIGTGSGCLAVALAHERPDWRVVATDISRTALAVARRNAALHGVTRQVSLVQGTYLDGTRGTFDLIVSNPPYIRERDAAALPRDVLREPREALFGGPDGLRDITGVLDAAARALRAGGWCVVEIGFDQETDLRQLAASLPTLTLERSVRDLQGHPRVAVLRRKALESLDG